MRPENKEFVELITILSIGILMMLGLILYYTRCS